MKIADAIIGRILAKQAARKERRQKQFAADAYVAVTSQDHKPQYPRYR